MRSTDCPFCTKLAGLEKLPANELVWQSPNSVALLGPWQFYQGYCILVARRHVTELFHLPDQERRSYFDEMCLLARAIGETFQPDKLNYELLGNQVPHLHWHLFPRYRDDADALRPVWLALDRADRDERERLRLTTGKLAATATVQRLKETLHRISAGLGTQGKTD